MDESFSVIIPARNAGKTISRCLESVFAATPVAGEVIVVDDGSTDRTADIAAQYPCRVIRADIGLGPMQPRFVGARSARFRTLVFVDADVCVRSDSFARILQSLRQGKHAAVTGLLARKAGSGFFAEYKNEYMNYIFKKQRDCVPFLYGSIWALKQEDMIYFDPVSDPFGCLVSDTEMGFRLRQAGKSIFLDKGLEVRHLKEYNFWGLLRNDFVIPFMFARIFTVYRKISAWKQLGGFSHAGIGQAAALIFAFAGLVLLTSGIGSRDYRWSLAGAGFLMLFYGYWLPFFLKLTKRGPGFLAKSVFLTVADAAVMFCGTVSGFLYSFFMAGKGIENTRKR